MPHLGVKFFFHIIRTILPYLFFAWLLLSVVLFVQQASRYADIFFSSFLPSNLVWQLTFALVPNVIAFTGPVAMLIGVIVGLSKLQNDSELIAMRASGIGNIQILLPIIAMAIVLSGLAFFINLRGVPYAAKIVRRVALQTAIFKIDSPIEPGVFNTEIYGYTIYVKDGDIANGTWKNLFIVNKDDKAKLLRVITAEDGRVDTSEEDSELVLNRAIVTTIKTQNPLSVLASEKVENLRFAIQTRRGDLLKRLSSTTTSPEEMGLGELSELSKTRIGSEKTEADILWYRRISMSLTPFVFALLGASLILRFNRGGRGKGLLLALLVLIVYYLTSFLGEQLARTEYISPMFAASLPIILSACGIAWFFTARKYSLGRFEELFGNLNFSRGNKEKIGRKSFFADLTAGILDFDIARSILRYLLLTLGFISAIYFVFTAFELWKFAGAMPGGIWLLVAYLFYLIPFVYLQLVPTALMIAVIATYAIKSRQNEIVTWTASGNSVYRLLFPCFVLMLAFGAFNWLLQEYVLPSTNRVQDSLRMQIRNKGALAAKDGKNWIASENRIYSFETPNADALNSETPKFFRVLVFETDSASRLSALIFADRGIWKEKRVAFEGNVQKISWHDGIATIDLPSANDLEIVETSNPFIQLVKKPSHLNSKEIREYIERSDSLIEQRRFTMALEKNRATIVLPFVICLFTAPFALSMSRRGRVIKIGYAVLLWLIFIAATSFFEQFGLSGALSPRMAIWSPLILFALIGMMLISKTRT